jgi:hypothetical protein
MARTTIDIDDPILKEIKAIQKEDGRSMGKIVTQLLAEALSKQQSADKKSAFKWISRSMRSRVDLSDKDEVYRILDRDGK